MKRKKLAVSRLSSLSMTHFVVDMFSGMLAGFLPVLIAKYSLSLAMGSFIVSLLGFSCNGFQLIFGNMRSKKKTPLFIQLGLIFSASVCFVGVIPEAGQPVFWLFLIVILTGVGVAMLHPEGLRGVCAVDSTSITPSVATSLFMLAGFSGASFGPLVSGVVVDLMGLVGLLVLIPIIIPLIWMMRKNRLKIANNSQKTVEKKSVVILKSPFTFWEIFIVSTFINCGCMVMQGFLPTFLSKSGFNLVFSTMSATLFGLGAGLSALLTSSVLIKRYSVIPLIQLMILIGLPILTLYVIFADNSMLLAPLALISGALVGAGFPQFVTLARSAKNGPSLSARMGLIVGGTWGIAGLFFILVGLIADHVSLVCAMLLSPISFFLAITVMEFLKRHHKRNG